MIARRNLVIASSAVLIGLGGLGVAAYAVTLPGGLPDTSHAPAVVPADKGGVPHNSNSANPNSTKDASSHGRGPDATGPAAYGLCTAWSHSSVHGKSLDHSVAMRNLADAAGGVDKIGAYCATVPKPSGAADDDNENQSNAPGQPANTHGATHPTGPPASHAPEPEPSD
jgi:hypothetical protein